MASDGGLLEVGRASVARQDPFPLRCAVWMRCNRPGGAFLR
jgi:hypothetical protein